MRPALYGALSEIDFFQKRLSLIKCRAKTFLCAAPSHSVSFSDKSSEKKLSSEGKMADISDIHRRLFCRKSMIAA